jgi:hypothetical protein
MSQFFKETAYNKIDPKKYAEGWERIFNNKEEESSGCAHKWEYLAQSIFKQCTECEHIEPIK